MNRDSIDKILLKCLLDQADDKEYETASKWIHENTSNLEYYRSIRDAWLASGLVKNRYYYNSSRAWDRVASRTLIRLINLPRFQINWASVAAVFIIALITGALSWHFVNRDRILTTRALKKEVTIEAPMGAKSVVVLSDSTKVWLNAGSRLSYSPAYEVSQRNVRLEGEAFFEVAQNKKLPFRVFAEDLVIEALGTSFNVKAYPEEDVVETTLVSGLARIERMVETGEVDRVLLRPNQRASFSRKLKRTEIADMPADADIDTDILDKPHDEMVAIHIKPEERVYVDPYVDIELFTSWKDDRWKFERKKMSDLATILQRIYNVNISIKDKELEEFHLTGILEQETLEQLLAAIRLTIPMDFYIKNNNIDLTLNKELKEKYERSQD